MYGLKRLIEILRQTRSGKTLLSLLAALTMILAGVTGGTLAWIESRTATVENTFTTGSIAIDLTETDTGTDGDGNPDTNQYELMPEQAISKDPKVTVQAGGEDCWLFVQLVQSPNFADFMEYDLADGWLPLPGVPGTFYRPVDSAAAAQEFSVLKDDQVHVKPTVSLPQLSALTESSYPTLTITALAVQRTSGDFPLSMPEQAWEQLQAQLDSAVH